MIASALAPPVCAATPGPSFDAGYRAFLKARNERLGRWLPHAEDLFEPWRRHLTASAPLDWNELFQLPKDATSFWYGEAGPPRVTAVYDPVRREVLYRQGCCAWEETVLVHAAMPPPAPLRTADLGAVRSRRGVALGSIPAAVVRAYGPARLHPSTTAPEFRVLSYYRKQHTQGSDCGWFENFVFRTNRLIEIQAGHGC